MEKIIDVAILAKEKNLLRDARVSPAGMTELFLYKCLSKDTSVRCSDWKSRRLTEHQKIYAAKDAYVHKP